MKNTSDPCAPASAAPIPESRYQLYRQTRMGTYEVAIATDSTTDAVRAFLQQTPAFEGGEIRLWDQWDQRVSAAVQWTTIKTDTGFPMFQRANVFHDRLHRLIADQIQLEERMRVEIRHSIQLSV